MQIASFQSRFPFQKGDKNKFAKVAYPEVYPFTLTHLCLTLFASSVDPDWTPHNAASDQGLYCYIISIKHGKN